MKFTPPTNKLNQPINSVAQSSLGCNAGPQTANQLVEVGFAPSLPKKKLPLLRVSTGCGKIGSCCVFPGTSTQLWSRKISHGIQQRLVLKA